MPSKTGAATGDGTLVATEAQVANAALRPLGDLPPGEPVGSRKATYRVISGDGRFPADFGAGLAASSNPGGGNYALHLYTAQGRFWVQMTADASDVTLAGWREQAPLESPAFTGSPKIRFGNVDNRIAVAAETSDPYDADLPIGTYIACCVNDNVQRALNSAVIQPRIQSQGQYVVSEISPF
ncbi:MAG: hypothetical protein LBQ69_04295 [Treponema sp.]|nr:hypothetical protein [Treponema sp.]